MVTNNGENENNASLTDNPLEDLSSHGKPPPFSPPPLPPEVASTEIVSPTQVKEAFENDKVNDITLKDVDTEGYPIVIKPTSEIQETSSLISNNLNIATSKLVNDKDLR